MIAGLCYLKWDKFWMHISNLSHIPSSYTNLLQVCQSIWDKGGGRMGLKDLLY